MLGRGGKGENERNDRRMTKGTRKISTPPRRRKQSSHKLHVTVGRTVSMKILAECICWSLPNSKYNSKSISSKSIREHQELSQKTQSFSFHKPHKLLSILSINPQHFLVSAHVTSWVLLTSASSSLFHCAFASSTTPGLPRR